MLPYASAAGPLSIQPTAVARPVDADDVSTMLCWASQHGESVVPRGAGTGMPGGNIGRGIALDIGACFRALGPWDLSGRTVRVEPGVLAGEVDRVARQARAVPSSIAIERRPVHGRGNGCEQRRRGEDLQVRSHT